MARGKYLNSVLLALNSIGDGAYQVHHKLLNTLEHGVPQNRPRWYCIGLLKAHLNENAAFQWPANIPCPAIDNFLDNFTHQTKLNNTAATNVANARKRIKHAGADPSTTTYIVDCDASTSKSREMVNVSPCLTRSRYNGHWITTQNRRMSKEEVFRLQGMDPTTFKVHVPPKALGQQLGNAMSVNVIERVLYQVLCATTFTPGAAAREGLHDRWADGTAHTELFSTKGFKFADLQRNRLAVPPMGSKMTVRGNPQPSEVQHVPSLQPPAMVTRKPLPTRSFIVDTGSACLLYTSPSPRDKRQSRMACWA